MSRQSISGSFPGGTSQSALPGITATVQSLQDTPIVPATGAPVRSNGATASVSAALEGPATSQKWSLLSVTVNGYLGLVAGSNIGSAPALSPYGRLGKIITALDPSNPAPFGGFISGSSGQPWSVNMSPLPADGTLSVPLFDPASDELPPWAPMYFKPGLQIITGYPSIPIPTQLLPVSATITPPNPIQLLSVLQPGIGIWMEPSLLGDSSRVGGYMGLTLFYATYTVDYDDGL